MHFHWIKVCQAKFLFICAVTILPLVSHVCVYGQEIGHYEKIANAPALLPILDNIKRTLEGAYLVSPGFYKDTKLKEFFGAVKVENWVTPIAEMSSISRYQKYSDLEGRDSLAGMDGFEIRIARTVKEGRIISANLSLRGLEGKYGLFTYDDIEKIFGPHWEEDQNAENEEFLFLTHERWNPPPKNATHQMGSKIIKYAIETKQASNIVTFKFTFDERLERCEITQTVLLQSQE